MSDTISQVCEMCGFEADCIGGLCQECILEEMREMREPEPDDYPGGLFERKER